MTWAQPWALISSKAPDDFRSGFLALHRRGEKAYLRAATPILGQLQKIVDGRAAGRGDQGHPLRIPGQGALAFLSEIPGFRQFALALLKGLGQQTLAVGCTSSTSSWYWPRGA